MNVDMKILIGIIIFFIILYVLYILLIYYNKYPKDKNILHNYFDDIYVITLPKRRQYIENIMNNLKINPIYFKAIDKNNLNYEELIKNNIVSKEYYKNENNGRIACHMSHISILKNFINSNKKNCLIFEDDISSINISYKMYDNIINESLKIIPHDWDIIKFGRCWDDCTRSIKISDYIYRVYYPKCRHAYGVSRSGANKIINNTIPMTNNGDEMIGKLISDGYIICYAISPTIFNQNREKLGSNLNNPTKSPPECKKVVKIR